MRAVARYQNGLLRVENPPIARVDPVLVDGAYYLDVRLRFAFDAIRVAAGFGRTVTLQLKTSANPTPQVNNLSPSFLTSTRIDLDHVSRVRSIVRKSYDFDLLKAVPDYAIGRLSAGYPIQYSYIAAVQSPQVQQARAENRISSSEYLVKKLMQGIDPATLKENFPVADPAKTSKSRATQTSGLDNFFTVPAERPSAYINAIKLSRYAVFEETIRISIGDFTSLPTYEFSFLSSDGTPLEYVEVNVDVGSFITQMKKIQYTGPNGVNLDYKLSTVTPTATEYVRLIKTTESLTSTEFKLSTSEITGDYPPRIVRRHYSEPGGGFVTPSFESQVTPSGGFAAKMSKASNQSTYNKPIHIPFYIDKVGEKLVLKIPKMPARVNRVSVLSRNITRKDSQFTEIASSISAGRLIESINITGLRSDCVHEFKISVTDLKMRTRLSSNTLTYSYKLPYTGASISVSQPTFIGDQTVKFSVAAKLSEAGRDDLTTLIDMLKLSGVSDTILSSAGFTSDPTYYSNVFSFRVEKIDLDTGAQSYTREIPLGTSNSDFFDTVASKNGAVFIFSLGLRSPTSLVPSQPDYKWGLFGGKPLSSLPSKFSIDRGYNKGADFSVIDSGVKKVVYVPTTRRRGAVSTISVSKTPRETNLLEWGYEGDITEVDHFQVLGSADGVECLLGCSFRSTSYEDEALFDRVGVVKYTIRPVYLTMEIGDSFSISIKKDSTLPSILEETFSNGQLWNVPVTAINSQMQVDTVTVMTAPTSSYYELPSSTFTASTSTTRDSSTLMGSALSKFKSGPKVSRSGASVLPPGPLEVNGSFISAPSLSEMEPATNYKSTPMFDTSMIIVPTNAFSIQATVVKESTRNTVYSTTIAQNTQASELTARAVENYTNVARSLTPGVTSTAQIDGGFDNPVVEYTASTSYVTVQGGIEIAAASTSEIINVAQSYTNISNSAARVASAYVVGMR